MFAGNALSVSFLSYIGASLILNAAADIIDPQEDMSGAGRNQMIRQPLTPHRIIYGQVKVAGPMTYVKSTESNDKLHILLTLASHELGEITNTIWIADKQYTLSPVGSHFIPLGRYSEHMKIWKGTGSDAGDADLLAALRSGSGGQWTVDHKQQGRAKLYIWLNHNRKVYPTGIPNIAILVKGRKVFDPREGGHSYNDPTTWEYSSNAALCVSDYLSGYDQFDRPIGLGESVDGINQAQLVAAANICDELVDLADGGTEKRYTCNGTLNKTQTPKQAIRALMTACGGRAVRSSGQWYIMPAAYTAPTVPTFDENDMAGPMQITTRVSRRDLFNTCRGTFVSPDHKWQPTDLPVITASGYVTEDGEESSRDFNFPFTISATTGQRLMKIELKRVRQQISARMPFKLSALALKGGDVIRLTNVRLGWTDKLFEVSNWRLIQGSDGDVPRIDIEITLRETAAEVFDWSTTDEGDIDPAPDTDLPDVFDVEPPTGIDVTEELYETRDGAGVKAMAIVTWAASPDAFLREYVLEKKLSADPDWLEAGRTEDTTFNVLDIAPGTYDFRVKAINTLSVSSDYSSTYNRVTTGLLAVPADITGLTIQSVGGLAILQWDRSVDLDVRIGGAIIFRHSPLLSGATWASSTTIGTQISGDLSQAVMPLLEGTYLARAEDSMGLRSVNAATVTTDAATILPYSTLDTINEHPDFSGAKVNCVVTDDKLQLDAQDFMDSWPDVDSVLSWDFVGGIVSSGTYTFETGFDFGAVTAVRISAIIKAEAVNIQDMIDARTENIDDWPDFDGTAEADVDAHVWARTTQTDPTGSPVWTGYSRVDASEFSCWGMEFKTELETSDEGYNIQIEELTVRAEELV